MGACRLQGGSEGSGGRCGSSCLGFSLLGTKSSLQPWLVCWGWGGHQGRREGTVRGLPAERRRSDPGKALSRLLGQGEACTRAQQ